MGWSLYRWHWFVHFFGLDNGSGPNYLFWSGVAGSFLTTMVGFGIGYWFHNVCHESGCIRVARHKVPGESGATYGACKRHHPHLEKRTPFHFAEHYDTAHHFRED